MSFTNIPNGYITPNGNVVMNDGTYGFVTPIRNVVINGPLLIKPSPINPSPINTVLPSQTKPFSRFMVQLQEAKAQSQTKPFGGLLDQLKKCKK